MNLASKEYSKAIEKHLSDHVRFITCSFGELVDNKVKEKGTQCKMARGEMVRYMAEKQIHNVEDIKKFHRLGYRYNKQRSDESTYVFILEDSKK